MSRPPTMPVPEKARAPGRGIPHAYRESGADAVMIERGSLGNPWIFSALTEGRETPPCAPTLPTLKPDTPAPN